MFEDIKYGLHAELLRDRGFEEAAERAVSRGTGSAIRTIASTTTASSFAARRWVAYPDDASPEGTTGGHSLRVELRRESSHGTGSYQARVPVRQGIDYRGYVWRRRNPLPAPPRWRSKPTRPADASTARHASTGVDGDWTKYTFTLMADEDYRSKQYGD